MNEFLARAWRIVTGDATTADLMKMNMYACALIVHLYVLLNCASITEPFSATCGFTVLLLTALLHSFGKKIAKRAYTIKRGF